MPARIPMLKLVGVGALALLGVGATLLGYRSLRNDAAATIYRDRLQALADDYERLRGHYDEAIRRTNVTELVVREGRLSVRVRNAMGVLREIDTPYDPEREIYVDYVVIDGRLWIRRVFDAFTPPSRGLVIDPEMGEIDWSDPAAGHGKAVYRRLGEGRWVVTVTGNGALGLARAGDAQSDLSRPPQIRDYEHEPSDADRHVRAIGFGDVWAHVMGGR